MKPRSSAIWRYFVAIDDGLKAECKLCHNIYSRKGRSTTPLKSHLRAMHPEEFVMFGMMDQIMKMLIFTDDDNVTLKKDSMEKLLVWEELQDEVEPMLLTEDGDGINKELFEKIKSRFAEKCNQYTESKKLGTLQKKMNPKRDSDPLAIKMERSGTDDVSIELEEEDNDFVVEYYSNNDDLKSSALVCSSSKNIATKRKRDIEPDPSSSEDVVGVKCDRTDLLFLGYASALKKMSRRRQITVKYEIAKLFMEAELSELE